MGQGFGLDAPGLCAPGCSSAASTQLPQGWVWASGLVLQGSARPGVSRLKPLCARVQQHSLNPPATLGWARVWAAAGPWAVLCPWQCRHVAHAQNGCALCPQGPSLASPALLIFWAQMLPGRTQLVRARTLARKHPSARARSGSPAPPPPLAPRRTSRSCSRGGEPRTASCWPAAPWGAPSTRPCPRGSQTARRRCAWCTCYMWCACGPLVACVGEAGRRRGVGSNTRTAPREGKTSRCALTHLCCCLAQTVSVRGGAAPPATVRVLPSLAHPLASLPPCAPSPPSLPLSPLPHWRRGTGPSARVGSRRTWWDCATPLGAHAPSSPSPTLGWSTWTGRRGWRGCRWGRAAARGLLFVCALLRPRPRLAARGSAVGCRLLSGGPPRRGVGGPFGMARLIGQEGAAAPTHLLLPRPLEQALLTPPPAHARNPPHPHAGAGRGDWGRGHRK